MKGAILMKKTLLTVISVLLCLSLLIPMGVCAFAEETQPAAEQAETVDFADYINTAVDEGKILETAGAIGDKFEDTVKP